MQSFREDKVRLPILGGMLKETGKEGMDPRGERFMKLEEREVDQEKTKIASNEEILSGRNPHELAGLEWSKICSIFISRVF